MRISLTMLVAVLALVPIPQNPPYEGRVQKPTAQVDFSHHSRIEKTSDNKFVLTNYVQNHSSTPLSVKWEKGGILCVGTHALTKGDTDTGKETGRLIGDPAAVPSNIKFGAKLNYSAPAQVYIDLSRQSQSASRRTDAGDIRETLFERRNEDGGLVYSVKITSTPGEQGESLIQMEVLGGLSVALGLATKDYEPAESDFGPSLSFSELNLRTADTTSAVMEWMRASNEKNAPRFYVVKNPGMIPLDVGGKLQGSNKEMVVKRVKVLAFFPDKAGVVGFDAGVYLPKDAKIW